MEEREGQEEEKEVGIVVCLQALQPPQHVTTACPALSPPPFGIVAALDKALA